MMDRFKIPPFKLKDYAYQCKHQIHCSFKYLVLIYDQMCDCADEVGQEDQLIKCEGEFDSLGAVVYEPDQFRDLIDDIRFQFDSENEGGTSLIAGQLLSILKDWCRKVTHVRLNTDHVYTTRVSRYNGDLIAEIVESIRLHQPVDRQKFLGLNHLVLDLEVTFNDLHYEELPEIGLNLSYCNYLIYDFLKEFYPSCGFYLSSNSVKPENLPFYEGKKVNSAYCHMYLVPLNLKECYFKPPQEPISEE
jgi:hypothetical protein